MARFPGVRHRVAPLCVAPLCVAPLCVALLCVARPATLHAQGGWRQWDVVLRDGTRVVANPLGAPDDAHLAISVGGMTGRDTTVARARVAYIAAQVAAESLPPAPSGASSGSGCEDVVVRLDGRRTTGRVTLTHVAYSEGVIAQRGVDVDLRDVAYVAFAAPRGVRTNRACRRVTSTAAPHRPHFGETPRRRSSPHDPRSEQ